MFKCFKCGKITLPREKASKIVLETREVEYTNKRRTKKGKEIIKVSNGTEIVREEVICQKCKEGSDV